MKKRKKYLLLSLSISFLTIFALIYSSTEEGIIQSFGYIKPQYVVLAMLIHIGGWFLWSLRTKILSTVVGLRISFGRVFRIILSSQFIGSLTPAYFGDLSRIYFLRKIENGGTGTASSIVFTERFLDVCFLLFAGVISLVLVGSELINIPNLVYIFVIIGFVVFLIIFGIFLTLFKPIVVKKLIKTLLWPINNFKPGFVESSVVQVDFFHAGLSTFLRKGKKELLIALIFTILFWGIELMIPYVIIRGVGAEIGFWQAWASYPLVLGIMTAPFTPGASGVAEVAFTLVYTTIAEIPLIGIVVLLWRLSTYYMNLGFGGAVSSFYLKNLDEVEKNIELEIDNERDLKSKLE